MNKLSALVLGLSMVLGTSVFAAQNAPKTSDKPAAQTVKTSKKHSKKHGKAAKKAAVTPATPAPAK